MDYTALLKTITFSAELKNITGLMIFYFVMIGISFTVNVSIDGIEKRITLINSERKREFIFIIYSFFRRITFIALFIPALIMLRPVTVLLFQNKFNLLILISLFITIFTFILRAVLDFISFVEGRKVVSILLIISALFFIIGNLNII